MKQKSVCVYICDVSFLMMSFSFSGNECVGELRVDKNEDISDRAVDVE